MLLYGVLHVRSQVRVRACFLWGGGALCVLPGLVPGSSRNPGGPSTRRGLWELPSPVRGWPWSFRRTGAPGPVPRASGSIWGESLVKKHLRLDPGVRERRSSLTFIVGVCPELSVRSRSAGRSQASRRDARPAPPLGASESLGAPKFLPRVKH